LGANSSLGKSIVETSTTLGLNCTGTTRRKNLKGSQFINFDIKLGEVNNLVLGNYDYVFISAGITSKNSCEQDPNLTRALNVDKILEIISAFSNAGAKVIYPSSTAVFNGLTKYPRKNSKYSPTSVYGEQKSEIEKKISNSFPEVSIIRFPKLVSSLAPLVSKWIQDLRRNMKISVFENLFISPVLTRDAARVMIEASQEPHRGIYQISSSESYSYLQIAQEIVERNGFSTKLLSISRTDGGLGEDNNYFDSLNPDKIFSGFYNENLTLLSVVTELLAETEMML